MSTARGKAWTGPASRRRAVRRGRPRPRADPVHGQARVDRGGHPPCAAAACGSLPVAAVRQRKAEERRLTPLERLHRETEKRADEIATNLVEIAAARKDASAIRAAVVIFERLYGRPKEVWEAAAPPVHKPLDEWTNEELLAYAASGERPTTS